MMNINTTHPGIHGLVYSNINTTNRVHYELVI